LKFEHLFSPMQVGKVTYRNRIVSAPMAFGLIVQNPDAPDFTYRQLEARAPRAATAASSWARPT